MQPKDEDLAFLIDILLCIKDIEDFTSGITYHQF